MRYLFFAFACVLTFACRGQANKNPYQVLDCANTIDENGLPVKRFELIGPRQTLRISDNGYCVLVHCTGESFEFNGDTVIAVKDLSVYNTCGTYEFPERPVLKELFEPEIFSGTRPRGSRTMVTPPPGSNFVLGINDDLCLQWESWRGAKGYIIKVSTVEGTSLLPDIHTTENKVTIPRNRIPKAPLPDHAILVDVFLDDKMITVSSIVIQADWKNTRRSFFSCPSSAFQAAMIAHHLEIHHARMQAEEFYKLAASRSSQPVYKELLERFLKRLENR